MINWKKILKDFAHKCGKDGLDLTNSNHLAWLRESIIKHDEEFRNNIYALNEFLGNLREGKEVIFEKRKPGEVWQTQSGWAGLKPGEKSAVYGMKSKETAQSYVSGQGVDKEVKERNSNSNVSSIDIDAMDGEAKKGGMEKKVKAPGNDTSTVNEIGVGYAMACMDESPEDVKGCLDGKLNDSKLGLKTSTPKRELIIQSARAERKRVDDYIKNPENGFSEDTKVSHVWGSKESLSSTVDKLGDQGVKEINGIPFDPNAELYDINSAGEKVPKPVVIDPKTGKPTNYASVILNGGGGEDPTDTTVVLVDPKTKKCVILHTSNKTTSQDIQGNGSPNEEIDSIGNNTKKKLKNPDNRKLVDRAQKDTQNTITNARKKQKEYVNGQSRKLNAYAKNEKAQKYMLDRLLGDEDSDPRGISDTKGKYWNSVQTHPAVKAYMKKRFGKDWKKAMDDPGNAIFGKDGTTGSGGQMEDDIRMEMLKVYGNALENPRKVKDNNPDSDTYGQEIDEPLRDTDVQIISRMFGETRMNVMNEDGPPPTVKKQKNKDGSLINVTKKVHGEEHMTGKKIPDEDENKFSNKRLKEFYSQQTDAINNNRLKLNEIGAKEGNPKLGDRQHTQRMIDRLHLNIADEDPHNPGGIPAENFQLNMGVLNNKAAIRKDKDGNFVSKRKDGYYKMDENGEWTVGPIKGENGKPLKKNDFEDNDCAVIADGKSHRSCLGLKEGEEVIDGFDVKRGIIEESGESLVAIIYSKGKPIAVQTCRSKSGPGGAVNDTLHWSQDYQKCLAEHTISSGRCG
jgi:hypothetical protein